MIDQLPLITVLALCLVAFAAGWVDSVVGGGGIIQMPALMIGLPVETPVATIAGTNKIAAMAGTATAAATYLTKVRISWPTTIVTMLTAYGGSSLGSHLVQYLPRTAFSPIIVVVVAVIGVYTWRKPQLGQVTALKHVGTAHWLLAGLLGIVVGLWDGVVGPGTGVFFAIGFVVILGYGFLEATAMTKLANLATNVAAIVVLGISGHILWAVGGCMAVCNLSGGFIGARMAIRLGNSFIRRVFLVAVVIVEAKLIYDTTLLFV
ncbi:MAG: TSUP family transporter [Propionibacteriaceae bacterium]|nr:TSUP family transporter [Propionibacteriaceae bacterium]